MRHLICTLCLSVTFGLQGQTIEQWLTDPGTVSSRFGVGMAATPKKLYVGAPNFKVGEAFRRGKTFTFDTSTLDDLTHTELGTLGSANEGAALAALKGDVIIGMPGALVSSVDAGMVMLHREKPNTFVPIANPFPAADDTFGQAVAVSSKLIVIGAPGDAGGPGSARSGSAFFAYKKSPVPLRLPLPSYATDDLAGEAVAVSNKYIAVGAPGTWVSGIANQGAVHIYNAKNREYLLTLTDAHIFGNAPQFGSSLVFSGKYLFIGSPSYDYGTTDFIGYRPAAGRVTQIDTRTWMTVRAFQASAPSSSADYGCSVAADRKYLAVGSRNHRVGEVNEAGKAEVFVIKTGERIADLTSPTPATQEHYGSSVLLLKKNRLGVGAPHEPSTTSDGKVYIHTFNP